MGAGSGAFNQKDILIDFPEEIIIEFKKIKEKYFIKENGIFYMDRTVLNCKAMPDALNLIEYFNYSPEKKLRLFQVISDYISDPISK
jgi:hypothetical protein